MQLDHDDIAAIAASVVSLMSAGDSNSQAPALVTAEEMARMLGVSRSWVYAHKRILGVIPVGEGSRPRLRFDPQAARAIVHDPGPSESARQSPSVKRKPPAPASLPDGIVLIRGKSGR